MLAWIGNLFIIIGLYQIGNKLRSAFLWSMVGESAWTVHALGKQDWAMAFICSIFLGMAVRSWIKWNEAK